MILNWEGLLMKSMKYIKSKIRDYERFIVTLLIISIYLYLGAINDIYVHPSSDGEFLLILSFSSVVLSLIFAKCNYKLKKRLEK